MFIVVSHFPSDDANCPGIEVGPVAATRVQAVDAWKEFRLSAYEQSGARDPQWDTNQPDSFESRIIDLASELHMKSAERGVIFADGGEEQAYLIEVPALPETLAARGKTLSRMGNHRGNRFYVHQETLSVAVSGPVPDVTTSQYLADYESEEAALAAHPGARPIYR